MSNTPDTEPAPSRPNWKWLVAAAIVFLSVEAASHWQEVSEFAHLPQIGQALGIG